jgi:hypothetical protein
MSINIKLGCRCMKCKYCGRTDIPATARFCGRCGHVLAPPSPKLGLLTRVFAAIGLATVAWVAVTLAIAYSSRFGTDFWRRFDEALNPTGVPAAIATVPAPAATVVPSPTPPGPNFRIEFIPARSTTLYSYEPEVPNSPDSVYHVVPHLADSQDAKLIITLTDDRSVSIKQVMLNGRKEKGCFYSPERDTAALNSLIGERNRYAEYERAFEAAYNHGRPGFDKNESTAPIYFTAKSLAPAIKKFTGRYHLKTGQSFTVVPDCGEIITVEIDTDRGDSKYTIHEK